jgi:hypothetical protein
VTTRFLTEEEQIDALKAVQKQLLLLGVNSRIFPMIYTGKDGRQVSDVAFLATRTSPPLQIVYATNEGGYDIWNSDGTQLLHTHLSADDLCRKISVGNN